MKKKKPMTVHEMARLGAAARNAALSPEERRRLAKRAIQARWAKAKKKGE
jgi:hypothetical protein